MPFLVPLAKAAKTICDGFQAGRFEIPFPKRMSWLLKAINLLPYSTYFWLVERGTRGAEGVGGETFGALPAGRCAGWR